jgi:hypothetical protein
MDPKDYITFDEDSPAESASATVDTITLNSLNYSNTTIGGGFGYSYPNASISASSYPYTITSGTGGAGINPWATSTNTKIKLDGKDADIEVNGRSLMGMIEKIEQRLNILHPNDELEAEWTELRELGDRYRELERNIREKQDTWDRLKAMPPPVME